jgi:chemotaxis protein MotB
MKKPTGKEQEQPQPRRRRVKKVKHGHGHHGGAWKVAYADFVTAMMALFLVLWLVSQADIKLKESIANYFRSPGVFDTMQGGILSAAKKVSKEPSNLSSKDEEQALFNVASTLQKKFETRPEFSKLKDQVKIEVTEDGLKIQILDKAERVSFQVGSSELTDEAKTILAEIAQTIKELPNPIVIGGHTDSRPMQLSNGYSNWELSADRANSARRFLESSGVTPKQINRIIGYADSDLMVPEDPFAPANRRISITIRRIGTPDAAPDPNDQKPPDQESKQKNKKELPKTGNPDLDISDKVKKELDSARNQLSKEGRVVVGEPDAVPDVKK